MLLFCINALSNVSFGQNGHTLRGLVVDENNRALSGASVLLNPIERGTITDEKGNFSVNNLQDGNYIIEISYIGYHSILDTIKIDKNTTYTARLSVAFVGLKEVVVTYNYVETRKKEESLNIEIVSDDYLKQNLGGSLMQSLQRLPGVTTIDIGSGQSKPVIRGLGFNRVVVVENNIKHEAQQWGADHGLEIDQYAVDHVEVIKGPASLMYGADAIGGVIDMKNKKLPAENTFGGSVNLSGKTNNDFLGTSIALYGRKNWLFANVRATILDYGDYKVPTDSVDIYSYRAPLYKNHLRNTAGNEKNLHLSLGIIQRNFQSKIFISNINSESGFFANAHGLEPRNIDTDFHDKSNRDINYPFQKVNHFKIINTSVYQREKVKIELDLGFQQNFRQEWSQYVNHGWMPAVFPDTLTFNPDLERQFKKQVYAANVKLFYQISDKTKFNIGLNGEHQNNKIDGRGFIIPAYRQISMGGYAFAKHAFSKKSLVQLGLRYDYGNINATEYYDWFPSPIGNNGTTSMKPLERAKQIDRNFSNISWSVGYNYNSDKWSFRANAGKSFRMPIAKELAVNGVNYHHFSYEVGNSNLSPEVSYQLDAGIEYNSRKLAIGVTPFFNHFLNYIYLNPTSDYDRLYGAGNQVFYYTQSKVLRFGTEIHTHYQIIKSLHLGVIGEYVYARQLSGEKTGFTLPFSPPASAIFNIKYQKQKIKFIENAYASVDYKITATQTNIVPPEEITDGYQVINIRFGGDVTLNAQQITISLQVQNLLNSKYFNHTSYYRLINIPEPGRNFVVNISIPFSAKINNQ